MIYLLEDDESIRKFVLYALNATGMEARGFDHPAEFWEAMHEQVPQLLLLDIMLPDEDGLTILRRLRDNPETEKLPIILLTARSTEYDKVVGLDSGADDYIAKPFGTMELISRIKALLRRTQSDAPVKEYTRGGLYVCPEKHIVRANGRDVTLTHKEFELLCLLLSGDGAVFSREQLLSRIWGYDYDGESRTVDVHIKTLRQKLGDCGDCIETVRGMGYKIGRPAQKE